MSRDHPDRLNVLGCPVDRYSASDLRDRLPVVAAGERLTHLVTLNPEQVMLARKDSNVRAIIDSAEIVTADGVGITIALRLQGLATTDRITGSEIVDWIAQDGLPVFFLGASDGVAQSAAARLRERHPAAQVAGYWSGGTPDLRFDGDSIRRIADARACVVCVAYGAPGQLRWIERNRRPLFDAGVRLAIGVGGSLDYHAGASNAAPRLIRRFGLEWLVRLIREPWRWRRQRVLPIFALLAIREAIQVRRAAR